MCRSCNLGNMRSMHQKRKRKKKAEEIYRDGENHSTFIDFLFCFVFCMSSAQWQS